MQDPHFHPPTLGIARETTAEPREDREGPLGKPKAYEAWHEGARPAREYERHPESRVFEALRGATGATKPWLVLGEPGAGKSELLAAWFRRWAESLGPPRLGMAVPVLVRLNKLTPTLLAQSSDSLADNLWSLALPERSQLPTNRSDIYREQAARLFHPVWLLDGLDEYPGPRDADLFARIAALPGTKLLTCRTAIFQSCRSIAAHYLENTREYEILPIPEREWPIFLQARLPQRTGIAHLVNAIRANAQLRELAGNAMMLGLIAELCGDPSTGITLPASRAAFLERAVSHRWNRRLSPERQRELRPWRDPVLTRLAQLMHLETLETGLTTLDAAREAAGAPPAIEEALEAAGLLITDSGSERVRFPHLTFQEYFLARSFLPVDISATVQQHWQDARFEETLALLLAQRAAQPDGRTAVMAALRGLIAWGAATHRDDKSILWRIGRSPLRTALHLLRRASLGTLVPERIDVASPGRLFRLALAKDAATPPETLARLAGDADGRVRQAVAMNSATPPETLARLAGDTDDRMRWAVARNSATPRETLARLAGDTDHHVREAVARNSATPPETLARLAGGTEDFVPLAVARNSATPPETLARLAGDTDDDVRWAVARNSATPPETLARLAGDTDKYVRYAAAENPATLLEDIILSK